MGNTATGRKSGALKADSALLERETAGTNQSPDAKGEAQAAKTVRREYPTAGELVQDRHVVGDEGPVMGLERRGRCQAVVFLYWNNLETG